jgi:hypothetical protein
MSCRHRPSNCPKLYFVYVSLFTIHKYAVRFLNVPLSTHQGSHEKDAWMVPRFPFPGVTEGVSFNVCSTSWDSCKPSWKSHQPSSPESGRHAQWPESFASPPETFTGRRWRLWFWRKMPMPHVNEPGLGLGLGSQRAAACQATDAKTPHIHPLFTWGRWTNQSPGLW